MGGVPASMSISVIGFPLGSYIGLASTSMLEDLTAGYEAPDLWGAAFTEDSTLTAGDRGVLGTESGVEVLTGVFLTMETRWSCLVVVVSALFYMSDAGTHTVLQSWVHLSAR